MKRVLLCLLIVSLTAAVACGENKLLAFHSQWCGPCQSMAPTVTALAQAGYAVQEVDIDNDPAIARQYGVTSIPCFIAVENGQEVDRAVGLTSYQRLETMVKARRGKVEVKIQGHRKSPTPAWQYERPEKHRSAVVRIYCADDAKTRSIGSGVLIRWEHRIVVLTARHVVQDAKKIVVELCTKQAHYAKVLKLDVVWDCAVLDLVGQPAGVEPADVEFGAEAMQQTGNRLESCGYGPDGKLASNYGLFLGYKRSSAAANGPDDWMELSGHARGGDSGGPIFNEQGHVVGILWGTNGEQVVGVQAGRLHKLLAEAVTIEPKAFVFLAAIERHPTPPLPAPTEEVAPLVPIQPNCPPGCDCAARPGTSAQAESARQIFGRKPIPQPPQVVVQSDPEVRQALGNIDNKIGTLIEQQRPKPPQQAPSEEPPQEEPSPLVAGLCILVAIILGFVIYFGTQKG
jgi:thioredoxin 1